jgi:hypothetical protein
MRTPHENRRYRKNIIHNVHITNRAKWNVNIAGDQLVPALGVPILLKASCPECRLMADNYRPPRYLICRLI